MTEAEEFEKRTQLEFLLPPTDDQLHWRIDAACNLLVGAGLAQSMPYLLKRDTLVESKDRAAGLRAELRKKNPQVFVSASGNRQVGVDLTFLRGSVDAWSRLVFCLGIHCRPLPWPDQERLLVEAGDILHALTGFAIPYESGVELLTDSELRRSNQPYGREGLESQCRGLRDTLRRTGALLPVIHRVYLGGTLTHRAQPETLGWLNYWSAETCAYLGFPDATRDKDLLRCSYQTPAGGWLVKLTCEPLDILQDEHLKVFASTYERLPKLGIRVPTTTAAQPVPASDARSTGQSRGAIAIVGTSDVAAVERALKELLAASASSGSVTVVPGADGWTLIEADPAELLANDEGAGRPLLGGLCQRLAVIGCLLAVRSAVDAVLIEADASGHCRLSGGLTSEDDGSKSFHGMPIGEDLVRFEVMPFAFDLLDVDHYTQVLEMLRAEFERSAR